MATISTTLKLIDQMSDKLIAITSTASGLSSEFDAMKTQITQSEEQMNKFSYEGFTKAMGAVGDVLTNVGDKMTATLTLPGTLLGKKMYGAATDYETALAGVQKTTNATGDDLETLNQKLLDIAESMPIAGGYVQAAATMQMGAQFGIHDTAQLDKFTRTYEKLVTATDIQGESGAEEMAQFLNIVEGGAQNADRFGSVIVDLGNHFATTESAILSMATRMAATAELTDFATPDIMAFAAALTSVGINAEAGGSAAGKLMKSMQSAAEVGAQAMNLFGGEYKNATAFGYFISDKNNLLNVAKQLGVTTDYINSMYDAWLNLENYADISGKTADQFAEDWANNPAQNMLDFFEGLGALDASGQESAIAAMERMGITEIRLSNMVAAMSGKSDLLRSALEMAIAAYTENTALNREYDIFASTQESQNQMLTNKAQNAIADFGENVQEAVQPLLDYANGLLDVFNVMDEADQDKIIGIMGALMVSGPVASAMGRFANGIKIVGDTVMKLGANNTISFLGSAALAYGIAKLADVNGEVDELIEHAAGIRLSFDEESVTQALSQIQQVQGALDLLNGNEATEEAKSTSEAVKLGWGTQGMFNTALAYESALANNSIEQINTSYAAQISALEEQIIHSQDEAANAIRFAQIEELELVRASEVAATRQSYASAISDVFGGMIDQYPEEARRLKAAAQQYDLLNIVWQAQTFDWDAYSDQIQAEADWQQLMENMYSAAWDTGYLADSGYESLQQIMNDIAGGRFMDYQGWIVQLEESIVRDLTQAGDAMANNPFLNSLIQTILSDPVITDNLDFTALNGALKGAFNIADYLQAAQRAVDYGDTSIYGEYLVLGLAGGVEDNAYLMDSAFYTLRDTAISALQMAFDMHSPSRLMANYGVYLPAGMGEGVRMGETMLTAAIDAVCGEAANHAALILNIDSGYAVGVAFGQGMVLGIRSQQSRVTTAARSVARAAEVAVRTTLDIHSPSGAAEQLGGYFGEGFGIGILDSVKSVSDAAGSLAGAAWDELKMSDGDAKRLRSLAERETINHFTTAELHIDFTANNNINSNMDLDGVVTYLEDQLTERLQMAAEGVYS